MSGAEQANPAAHFFDFRECVKEVLHEVLKPVGRLEYLKSKVNLTAKEVEELYSIPTSSLSTWRSRGGGPEYIQAYENGPVRYTHAAIKEFQNRGKMRG